MIRGPIFINVHALQFCHGSIVITLYTWISSIMIQHICGPSSILISFLIQVYLHSSSFTMLFWHTCLATVFAIIPCLTNIWISSDSIVHDPIALMLPLDHHTHTHTHKQRHIYIYIHTHVMLPFCLIYIYMYLSCGLWLIHIYIEAWFCAGSLSFMNVCLLILFLFWFHFDPCICKLFLLWYHFGQHICVTLVSDMTSSWFNNYIHDPWSYFHQYMYIPDPPWFRCYKHVYMFEFKSWSTTSKPSSQANNKRNKQACGGACMIFPGSFLLRNFTILISKQSIVFNVPCFGTIRN